MKFLEYLLLLPAFVMVFGLPRLLFTKWSESREKHKIALKDQPEPKNLCLHPTLVDVTLCPWIPELGQELVARLCADCFRQFPPGYKTIRPAVNKKTTEFGGVLAYWTTGGGYPNPLFINMDWSYDRTRKTNGMRCYCPEHDTPHWHKWMPDVGGL